jgi:hypothetical protein
MHARRRFGILDALILIAFTALGIAGCKASGLSIWRQLPRSVFGSQEEYLHDTRIFALIVLFRFLSFLLVAWTFSFLVLRYRNPRPSFRRLGHSPGTAACLTVFVVLTVSFGARLAWWIPWSYFVAARAGFDGDGFGELCYEEVKLLCGNAGPAIIATWFILGVMRSIRLERDWVEVFGLILVLGWAALLFEGLTSLL